MTITTCLRCAGALLLGLTAAQAAPGDPLTPPIQANQSAGTLYNVQVERAPTGEFVVGWAYEQGFSESDIRARVFAADGTALSGEFDVTSDSGRQDRFDVAIADGVVAIAWQDGNHVGNAVRARRFAYDGSPLEARQTVSSFDPIGVNTTPMAALTDGGGLAVGWAFERTTASPRSCSFPRLLCAQLDIYEQELRMRWVGEIEQTTLVAFNRARGELSIPGFDVLPSPTPLVPENSAAKLSLSGFEATPDGEIIYLWALQLAPVGSSTQILQLGRVPLDGARQPLPKTVELLQGAGGFFCLGESLDVGSDGLAVVLYTDNCEVFARRMPRTGTRGPRLDVDAAAPSTDRINPNVRVATGVGGAFSAVYADTLVPFASATDSAGVPVSLGSAAANAFDAASDASGELVIGTIDSNNLVFVQRFEGP